MDAERRTPCVVLRRCVCSLVLCTSACLGTNPYWDAPPVGSSDASTDGDAPDDDDDDDDDDAGEGHDVDGETAAHDDDGGAASSTGAADDNGSETSTTTGGVPDDAGASADEAGSAADEAGSSSDDGTPTCEPEQAICNGECTNIDKDKHACGVECIDCTALYGNHARCKHGQCEDH